MKRNTNCVDISTMHFGRLLLRSACGRRCPVVPSLLTSSIRNAASRGASNLCEVFDIFLIRIEQNNILDASPFRLISDYSSSSSFVPNERRLLTRLQDPGKCDFGEDIRINFIYLYL